MEQKKFNFSQDAISQNQKKFLILRIFLPFFILALIVFPSAKTETKGELVFIFILTVTLIELIFAIIVKKLLKKLNESNLSLSDANLELYMYGAVKSTGYNDITRIDVRKNNSGKILSIIIKTPCQKIRIFGLENMESILNEITTHLMIPEIIKEKISFDTNNPYNFLILFIAGMGAYLLIPKVLSLFLWGIWGMIIVEMIFFIIAIAVAAYLYQNTGGKLKKWILMGGIVIVFNGITFLIRANKMNPGNGVSVAKNDFVFSSPDNTYKILIPKSYTYISYDHGQNILFVMNREINKRPEDSFTIMDLGQFNGDINYDATIASLIWGKNENRTIF